jgi:hypothetical protein
LGQQASLPSTATTNILSRVTCREKQHKKRRHRYDPDIHKFRYSGRINEGYPFEYGNRLGFRETLNLLSLFLGEIVKAAAPSANDITFCPRGFRIIVINSQVIMA